MSELHIVFSHSSILKTWTESLDFENCMSELQDISKLILRGRKQFER